MPRYVNAPSWILAALVGLTLCFVLLAFIAGNQPLRLGAADSPASTIAAPQSSR
jgi:hypothetical protein